MINLNFVCYFFFLIRCFSCIFLVCLDFVLLIVKKINILVTYKKKFFFKKIPFLWDWTGFLFSKIKRYNLLFVNILMVHYAIFYM